ncbi:MAG: hypothetical protein IEMM0002_0275 [bacterium]|nr:MAG: hypothetical protein IEMM0002_0275 [bacterium]
MDFASCYKELGFTEAPFRITPDTSFFFPGNRHTAALKHLQFGLISGGFTLLTGEIGLGKTLLCRQLLKTAPEGTRAIYIFNPHLDLIDLLKLIYHNLTGIHMDSSSYDELLREINISLVKLSEEGKKVAVVIDEAHRLGPEVLEGLRLLSNLETEKEKLIYLILSGQPELDRTLALRRMRPLAQRISIRYRLKPFRMRETVKYINHRVKVASNYNSSLSFTKMALRIAHYSSGGVPRRINQICDRALLAAFSIGKMEVGAWTVWQAAREVKRGV